MTKRTLNLLLFVILFFGSELLAQNRERILIPFWHYGEIRGAHGSRWISELSVTNLSDEIIGLGEIDNECRISGCLIPLLARRATIFPYTVVGPGPLMLTVLAADVDDVAVNLRIQDLSRQGLTWGTEIPVVSERDAFMRTLPLTNIPLDARFRTLLRVYDFDYAPCHRVKLRAFRVNPLAHFPRQAPIADELLLERELIFDGRSDSARPGYVELSLDKVPELVTEDRIRIEIVPLNESLRFWAFVSVTNNETQHVTLVTPRSNGQEFPSAPTPITAACERPAPLFGNWNPAVSTLTVQYQFGVNSAEKTPVLAQKYGFDPLTVTNNGFVAELTPKAIAALRCESDVAHIEYDSRGCR